MAISNEILARIYRDMIRHRTMDYQFIKDSAAAKIPTWHSGLGEETIVAPVALLRKDDYVTYTHRAGYVWLAKGILMKEIVAEKRGKATGCAGGYGGTHILKPSLGIFGRSGMQGGHFSIAIGLGIAAQLKGKGQVAMMFFGDGCGTKGQLHEAFNFASIWKLPIVWVCENNGQSMSVRLDKTWAIADSSFYQGKITPMISKIASNYNMPGKTVDGDDAIAVAEAAQEYIDRARSGQGPALLEMQTYRWRGHYEGDAGTAYRTKEEVETMKKRDPIPRIEKALIDKGILTKEDALRIQKEADAEVAEAEKFADESPDPNPEEAPNMVYATSHT